jgi:hypothetical protein
MPKIISGRRLALTATAGALAAGTVVAPMNTAGAEVSRAATGTPFVITAPTRVGTVEPPPDWENPPKCNSMKCHKKWRKKWRHKQEWENTKRWMKRQWEDWFSLDPWKRERDRGENIGPFREGRPRPRMDPDHQPGPPRH